MDVQIFPQGVLDRVGRLGLNVYCKFGIFCEGFIFAKLGSLVKTKSSRNVEITRLSLSGTYIGKSCPSLDF